jgi:hypothetical protein
VAVLKGIVIMDKFIWECSRDTGTNYGSFTLYFSSLNTLKKTLLESEEFLNSVSSMAFNKLYSDYTCVKEGSSKITITPEPDHYGITVKLKAKYLVQKGVRIPEVKEAGKPYEPARTVLSDPAPLVAEYTEKLYLRKIYLDKWKD